MTTLSLPRPARQRRIRAAAGLWILLAIVVFNVRFDWQTRAAGHAFVQAQLARQQQDQPVLTINDGFRPMVRAAARDAAGWLVLIAAAGTVVIVIAATRENQRG
jgi:hypothetical protein